MRKIDYLKIGETGDRKGANELPKEVQEIRERYTCRIKLGAFGFKTPTFHRVQVGLSKNLCMHKKFLYIKNIKKFYL